MKLRNKKTGEVFDALIREKGGGGSYSLIVCDIKAYEQSKSTLEATHFVLDEYDSLAGLNEEWEDVEPQEPLIEDEEIREIIRAWAKVNDATKLKYNYDENSLDDIYRNTITFNMGLGLKDGEGYTIAELCGTPPEPIEPTFIDLDERIKEKEEE